MTIDNFDHFRRRITFKEKTDRYIVHILCRPKDFPEDQRIMGSNEQQRFIRTYYIDSLEYFNGKEEAIKLLCRRNHARGYILPQVRDNFECLLNLGSEILSNIRLRNYSVKPDALLRSAYCGCHNSRNKQWIIDLDNDNLTEYRTEMTFGGCLVHERAWSPDEVQAMIGKLLTAAGKNPADCYRIPTKAGCHLITPPFSLNDAVKECSMFYEGVRKTTTNIDVKSIGPNDPGYIGAPGLDKRFIRSEKDIVGWLHKDGMSLLYYSDDEES